MVTAKVELTDCLLAGWNALLPHARPSRDPAPATSPTAEPSVAVAGHVHAPTGPPAGLMPKIMTAYVTPIIYSIMTAYVTPITFQGPFPGTMETLLTK